MNDLSGSTYRFFMWVMLFAFIIFYPMLISIYVFLPLLIGIMGYILILGIEDGKLLYVLIALIYFINLEVNLSLPYFLTTISTLFVYVVFYHNLVYFRRCHVCKLILTVTLIDFVYLISLLSYDFIYQTSSVKLDLILLYSLVVDMLVVVIL